MSVSSERARGQELPRLPEMVAYVPAVQLRDAGVSPPTLLSDLELSEAVARAGGRVLIGIKAAGAVHSRVSGEVTGKCGTSMSAAFVTGSAALVWSRYPALTANTLRNKLQSMAVPLPYPATHVGAGRVVAYEPPPPPPPPPTASIHGPTFVRPGDTCLYYATSTSGHTPLIYNWSVDGVPMPYFGPNANHPIGSSSFSLDVLVEDGIGNQMHRSHFVTVDPEAPECLDA